MPRPPVPPLESGADTSPCDGSAVVLSGPDQTSIDADLGWALGVVFRSYLHTAGTAVHDVPAGPRGYQVLAAAVREDPRPQAVLAQHLGVDRTVMTYLVDDLERAGLIERLPDPADRRVRRIGATDAGRATLLEMDARLRTAEDVVLGVLTPAEAVAFRDMVRRLACRAASTGPDGSGSVVPAGVTDTTACEAASALVGGA